MKLAKLSLAAIVAAGAMTTFANAAPLEEAIKGVDLKGFIRYRHYAEDGNRDGSTDRHRFSAPFTFTIPVADNLKAGINLRFESDNFAKDDALTDGNVNTTKAWFLYSQPDYSVKAGRFEINTPWTDPGYGGNRGDGVLGMFTGVEGWTFAGAAFANTNISAPIGSKAFAAYLETATSSVVPVDGATNDGVVTQLGTYKPKSSTGVGPVTNSATAYDFGDTLSLSVGEENVYALAAIGAMGPVNVQAWVATMDNVFDHSVFIQADTKFEGFSLKAQANQLKLADEVAKIQVTDNSGVPATGDLFGDDTGLFWAAEAGFGMAGFNVAAGYISNDDDQPIHTLSADDAGMIKFGKQLYYETTNAVGAETMYGKAGYGTGPYSLEFGFGTAELDGDDYGDEWYVGAGYKYSKNFAMGAYYSDMDMEDGAAGTGLVSDVVDNKQIRFEAKYSF